MLPCSLLPLADKPEPWVFTAYRVFGALLNLLMWLLLLGVVACLMFMLLWLGGAVAVNAAITQGTRYADASSTVVALVVGPAGWGAGSLRA
jgi:hypothetical protein